MKIATIELAGSSRTVLRDGGPGIPRAFARITRLRDSEFIDVEILAADRQGVHVHHVQADSPADIETMAEGLHEILEGYAGSDKAVEEYAAVLQQFADGAAAGVAAGDAGAAAEYFAALPSDERGKLLARAHKNCPADCSDEFVISMAVDAAWAAR